jgi:hypothetical protein
MTSGRCSFSANYLDELSLVYSTAFLAAEAFSMSACGSNTSKFHSGLACIFLIGGL